MELTNNFKSNFRHRSSSPVSHGEDLITCRADNSKMTWKTCYAYFLYLRHCLTTTFLKHKQVNSDKWTSVVNFKWIDQHDKSVGNLSPQHESNPWPLEHRAGALSTEQRELMLARASVVSFWISLRWPIHGINPVDKFKLSCNTPHDAAPHFL